jgi:RNA polymerase sigma-70 factor (ECF subfamily)
MANPPTADALLQEQFAQRLLAMGPKLMRQARRILRQNALAEDAVSQAYLAAWKARRRLADSPILPRWLGRACRNAAIDLYRRSRRERTSLEQCSEPAAPPPAAAVDDSALRAELLSKLPSALKVCAQMFFIDGRGIAEIARLENLPLSTVRGRIHQARVRLRKEIVMDTQPAASPQDPYDDGVIDARSTRWVDWRGMRVKLLGLAWAGHKVFYGPNGGRLRRVPEILRKSSLLNWSASRSRAQFSGPADAEAILRVFWQTSGQVTGYVFAGLEVAGVQGSPTTGELVDRQLLTCAVALIPQGQQWLKAKGYMVGAVDRSPQAAVRFNWDHTRTSMAASRGGWGSVFVFAAQNGPRKATCRLTLAYSSHRGENEWAVLALDAAGREVDSTDIHRGNASCNEGHLTGMQVQFPLAPDQVRGIVFRPRPKVAVQWGRLRVPPGPDGGNSKG